MIKVEKPDQRVREQRIETLHTAIALTNTVGSGLARDWSQIHRFERALVDVALDAVLPRTEEALAEALTVIRTHA